MIIDTDVLVWYLCGSKEAQKTINSNIPFKISVVTYLELIQGVRDKRELRLLQKYLREWSTEIIQMDETISTRAMFLVEDYYLSHSMETGDAMIAATAIENQEILLTANDKHYSFIPNIQIDKFRPK